MPYENLSDYFLKQSGINQQRNKELMQEQLFQSNQAQTARDWSANNMTAYEKANLAQQEQDRTARAHENLTEDKGWVRTDENGAPVNAPQQSPAQKATTPPADPFDFLKAGQANPAATGAADQSQVPGQSGGGNGALTPTSIQGGSPSGSSPTPSGGGPTAPSIASLLLPPSLSQGPLTGTPGGAPQGNAVATTSASRASSAQAGPLAQLSQGSTTPSETGAGQGGQDSGALPPAGSLPAQQGQPTYPKPDVKLSDGSYYRRMTSDEQNERVQTQARANAAASRQASVDNAETAINDPKNATLFQGPEGQRLAATMRAYAQSGQKVPVPNQGQTIAALGTQYQQALADGDKARADQIKQVMDAVKPQRTGGPQDLGGFMHSGMNQNGVDSLARQFRTSGQMPALGMGGLPLRTAIIQRAADMADAEGGPDDIASSQAAFKANSASLAAMTKQHDNLISFENTAKANIDLFEQQAENLKNKYVDTGIPWLNTAYRDIQNKFAGNPDVPAYLAARETAVRELGKVLQGGNLGGIVTDQQIQDVKNAISDGATLDQTLKTFDVFKDDMENRRIWNEAQIKNVGLRVAKGMKGFTSESFGAETPKSIKSVVSNSATPTPSQPRQWFDNHSVYSDDGGKTHYDYKTGKKLD